MVSVKDKRVLVTGGSGVIGRELIDCLLEKGADVLSADRVPYGGELHENLSVVQINLDSDDISPLRAYCPETIFHLAASFERSSESKEFWVTNWRDNILASHRMVDLARWLPQLKSFIFSSSYLVYFPLLYSRAKVDDKVKCLNEDALKDPRNLCGAAKLYAEKELEFLRDVVNPDLKVVFARIYRVFGRGSQAVISRWVRAALRGETIEVYNKQNRFDYIFAGDVAEGLLTFAEESRVSGPVNLGSGCLNSIEDVLGMLREVLGDTKMKIIDHGHKEDFEASCADMSRMKELTSWTSKTSLKEGIKLIVKFERDRLASERR